MTNPMQTEKGKVGALAKLEAVCEEIFARWDTDQRSGKLLSALSGNLQGYRADVTEIRAALASHDAMKAALEAHDQYMLDAGYEGPENAALHPKAAENWRRVRAALSLTEQGEKP